MTDIDEIKIRLLASEFSGLYYPGECGCGTDDLAPCGNCEQEDGEEWINGCDAGYKHVDTRGGDFVISQSKEPPTPEEFDNIFDAM